MRVRETVRRAFSSFLAIPTGVILLFALLAVTTYWLDKSDLGLVTPIRDFMGDHVFGEAEGTSKLLATIAGGVITITSITFSLLLLALQQSAGAMTHDVFDQFLRRRANQVYFGFFVGLTLYALIILISVDPPFNPILGASLALLLTIAALYVLLLLIYATISQMRPTEIIRSIHDLTLQARERQRPLIHRTLRTGRLSHVPVAVVTAPTDGFVADIDIDAIGTALADLDGSVEVVYLRSVGSYVAFQDPIAEVRAERAVEVAGLVDSVAAATHLVQDRDIDRDPAYGIKQLTTIAWRSISTSQQNPGPGAAAINAFHDLLARWSGPEERDGEESPVAVVYPDNVMSSLFGGLESLAVVASEAMQHQTYAAILNVLAVTFDRLDAAERRRAEDLVLRSLSGLGDHVLTLELDDALAGVARTLDDAGATDTAHAVRSARNQLAESIGSLNSRATRVPSGADAG